MQLDKYTFDEFFTEKEARKIHYSRLKGIDDDLFLITDQICCSYTMSGSLLGFSF